SRDQSRSRPSARPRNPRPTDRGWRPRFASVTGRHLTPLRLGLERVRHYRDRGQHAGADMESPVALAVHNVAARAIRERRPVGVQDFLVDALLALPSDWGSHAESITDRALLAVPLTVQGG